ncbi:MAG: YkgJ family cysteine cluster protein [Polyangia bacterium]
MSDSLRSELEEALRFLNHNSLAERLERADVAATVAALVETLVAHGVLPPSEFERRRQRALDKQKQLLEEQQPEVRFGEAVDKYALKDLPQIDCASILPVCKARCCTLTVYCSAQDLDERVVQWDYSRPYRIRKREDDYCVHSDAETRRCGIYERRPAICRTYDCRQDKRIWQDFDRRILAERP